jgi:hypothetical protein
MSVVLQLPPELEAKLTAEASQAGISLADYLIRVLANCGPKASNISPGAKVVEHWHDAGVIGTRTDIDNSQQHARNLRERAERREHP